MKTLLKTVTFAVLIAMPLMGMTAESTKQSTDNIHNIVFEVAMDGAEKWEGALRNVENVRKSLGANNTKIEVVVHGQGIGMLLAKTSTENVQLKAKLEQLHGAGVIFAACENTMKREKIDPDDLVSMSTTVDAGVSEVIRKQEQGCAYIKSGG